MERGGYYNAHSKPQASAGDLGIPLLQRAAADVPVDDAIFGIADLGAAQGKNSIAPMDAAIAALRARGPQTPIAITHTDIPSNDFTSLFELLGSHQSYLTGTQNVFAYAAGVSFYERIFPANTQMLGWNSIAVHWLSSVPANIRNDIWSPNTTGDARATFRKRAAEDWNAFLDARAVEFRQGGQIVVVGSGANDEGFAGAEGLMKMANEQLQAMVADGTLSAAQYATMAIPTYYRTRAEFEAPFREAGSAFTLVESTPVVLDDPFWPAYEQSRDASAFAQAYVTFFRAFSEPCLFDHPSPASDAFYAGVEKRIAADPAAAVCRWQLFLLRFSRNSTP